MSVLSKRPILVLISLLVLASLSACSGARYRHLTRFQHIKRSTDKTSALPTKKVQESASTWTVKPHEIDLNHQDHDPKIQEIADAPVPTPSTRMKRVPQPQAARLIIKNPVRTVRRMAQEKHLHKIAKRKPGGQQGDGAAGRLMITAAVLVVLGLLFQFNSVLAAYGLAFLYLAVLLMLFALLLWVTYYLEWGRVLRTNKLERKGGIGFYLHST